MLQSIILIVNNIPVIDIFLLSLISLAQCVLYLDNMLCHPLSIYVLKLYSLVSVGSYRMLILGNVPMVHGIS